MYLVYADETYLRKVFRTSAGLDKGNLSVDGDGFEFTGPKVALKSDQIVDIVRDGGSYHPGFYLFWNVVMMLVIIVGFVWLASTSSTALQFGSVMFLVLMIMSHMGIIITTVVRDLGHRWTVIEYIEDGKLERAYFDTPPRPGYISADSSVYRALKLARVSNTEAN